MKANKLDHIFDKNIDAISSHIPRHNRVVESSKYLFFLSFGGELIKEMGDSYEKIRRQ
jgi:hypothetical protein